MPDIDINIFTSRSSHDLALVNTLVDEFYFEQTKEGSASVYKALTNNPYPGLRPFKTNESIVFFGREGISETLVTRIANQRFLAILGSSGTGKSSLVRAGLLPSLNNLPSKHGCWKTVIFRPGKNPFGNLARALYEVGISPGSNELDIWRIVSSSSYGFEQLYNSPYVDNEFNTLIVVDQFEELFRYKNDNGINGLNDAALFVKMLIEISKHKRNEKLNIYVLITMRSEYLGDCVQLPGLVEIINEGQFLVPRLTPDQLIDVIIEPLEFSGASIGSGVADKLSGEIGDNMDQLPLLQHALRKSYEHAQEAAKKENAPIVLTYECYDAIGRMSTALDKHGNKIYDELNAKPNQQKYCEMLFKGLADRASDGKGIRRPLSFRTILKICLEYEQFSKKEVDEHLVKKDLTIVVDKFRSDNINFIMPPQQANVSENTELDISHESMMRVWMKLKEWMEEEAEDARLLKELLTRAGDSEDFLKTDKLSVYKGWLEKKRPGITWATLYKPADKEDKVYLDEFNAGMALIEKSRIRRRNLMIMRVGGALAVLSIAVILIWVKTYTNSKLQSLAQAEKEVLALTKEDFYQSRDDAFLQKKDSFVIALIDLKYTRGDTPRHNNLLSELNWAARASSVASQDPNTAVWLAKKSFENGTNKWTDSLLTATLNRYCYYIQENTFLHLDSYERLIAVSRDNKHVAVKTGDTIRLGTLKENKITFYKNLTGGIITKNLDSVDDFDNLFSNDIQSDHIQFLSFTDDRHVMACIKNSLYEWDVEGKKEPIAGPDLSRFKYESIAISPDGKKVVTNTNGITKIWKVTEKQLLLEKTVKMFMAADTRFSFSSNSKMVLATPEANSDYLFNDATRSSLDGARYQLIDIESGSTMPPPKDLPITYATLAPAATTGNIYILAKIKDSICLFDHTWKFVDKYVPSKLPPQNGVINKYNIYNVVLSSDWKTLLVTPNYYNAGYVYQIPPVMGNGLDSVFHLNKSSIKKDQLNSRKSSTWELPPIASKDFLTSEGKQFLSIAYEHNFLTVSLWKTPSYFADMKSLLKELKDIPPMNIVSKIKYDSLNTDTLWNEKDISDAANYFYRASRLTTLATGNNKGDSLLKKANVLFGKLVEISPRNDAYQRTFERIGLDLYAYDSNYNALRNNLKSIIKIMERRNTVIYQHSDSIEYYKNRKVLSQKYGKLSYYFILDTSTTDYTDAISLAKRGLELNSTSGDNVGNLVLSYLLSYQFQSVDSIYHGFKKGKYYDKSNSYIQVSSGLKKLRESKIIDESNKKLDKEAKKIEDFLQDKTSQLY